MNKNYNWFEKGSKIIGYITYEFTELDENKNLIHVKTYCCPKCDYKSKLKFYVCPECKIKLDSWND